MDGHGGAHSPKDTQVKKKHQLLIALIAHCPLTNTVAITRDQYLDNVSKLKIV